MAKNNKRDKNPPPTKAKSEVKTRQKNIQLAKEAGQANKKNGRRSTSVVSTGTVIGLTLNFPVTPTEALFDSNDQSTAPTPNAQEASDAETVQGPTREEDIFNSDLSEGGTNPPMTESEMEDEDGITAEDRLTPTPRRSEGVTSLTTPSTNKQNHAPGEEPPAPMPNLGTPSQETPSPKKAPVYPINQPLAKTPTTQTSAHAPVPGTSKQSTSQNTEQGEILKNKPTSDTDKETTADDDEPLKELHQIMKNSSESALTGGFRINVKTFSPPKGNQDPTAKRTTKHRIEWQIIKKGDLLPELQHTSSNHLDMMSQYLIKECTAAANDRPHNLGLTAQILVEKGYKWLFKLMSFSVPKEKQSDWITHAIRSVLASAGVSLSSLLATVDLSEGDENPHQWTLVSFTKDAYNAFAEIRLIFDPRSGSAVSVREWTMDAPRTQVFSIGAVVTSSDSDKAATEIMKRLQESISELLKNDGVSVTRTALAITPKSGKVRPVNVHLRIDDSIEDTFTIPPTLLQGLRVRTPRGTRVSSCRFGRLCPNCGSDSHIEKKECPWISYKIGEKRINFDVPRNTVPGRVVEPKTESKKRKRDDGDSDDESSKMINLPKMRDARPTKRQKPADPKGKGRDTAESDEDRDIVMM